MKSKVDLSIVIVSFNTQRLLRNCLNSVYASLKNSPFSCEIIVVDNVSTDGTRPMLKQEFPQVRTLLNKENVGFGRANNQGIKIAQGEYIFLLNSDTLVLEEALTRLLIFAKSYPRSFVGPKLLNPDRSPQTSCGPFLTLPVVLAALFLRGDRWGLTRWSPRVARRVDWVSGAALLGPRELFLNDLLFDEKIFMYMEELDLLYRAQKKGYLTYFYPEAQIVHLGGGSSLNKKKDPVLNIYRGLLYFYQKHYGPLALLVLKLLLKLKARIAWFLGILTGNSYLRQTYAEAYQLV